MAQLDTKALAAGLDRLSEIATKMGYTTSDLLLYLVWMNMTNQSAEADNRRGRRKK